MEILTFLNWRSTWVNERKKSILFYSYLCLTHGLFDELMQLNKGNAKECSSYRIITLISHTSKLMLKNSMKPEPTIESDQIFFFLYRTKAKQSMPPWWFRQERMWETWVLFPVGKIPWRRAWQLTPVFLPGESHGQRSLAGYSPRGHKESDMTEQLSTAKQN